MRRTSWLMALAVLGMVSIATAAAAADADHKSDKNHFGTIRVDGKKIGQVQYTVSYDEQDQVDEVRTRASYSVLGFEAYHFTQNVHEVWQAGELQTMRGDTDDDGKKYRASLERTPEGYKGVLNDKPLTLPHDAFPNSVWHYAITEQSLLFNLADLRLMKVEVTERADSVKIGKRTIPAQRFDFSGEWEASVWFDQDRQVVRFEYQVDGHDVVVTLDPS